MNNKVTTNQIAKMGLALIAVSGLAACASAPRGGIQSELVRIGLSSDRARCIARETVQRLEPADARDLAVFLSRLNKSDSAGNVLDTVLTIDNPRAAAAFGRAGISCAF